MPPNDTAYWLYVQAHFESDRGVRFDKVGATMTVRVPRANVVTPSAMRLFAEYRDRVLTQIGGLTHHD
jgi:hypothetical protein